MSQPSAPLIKICGTTSVADARLARQAGADYVGVIIDHPVSPRSVTLEAACAIRDALEESATAHDDGPDPLIAVTVNKSLDQLLEVHRVLCPHALQLHGDESLDLIGELAHQAVRVWAVACGQGAGLMRRAEALVKAGAEAVLIDARDNNSQGVVYGGTGLRGDWDSARQLSQVGLKVILAGGLNPGNVTEAVETVGPWMVDVVSGVESRKGVKDTAAVRAFVKNARAATAGSKGG